MEAVFELGLLGHTMSERPEVIRGMEQMSSLYMVCPGSPLPHPDCPVRPPILSPTLWFRVQVYSFLVFSQSWAALGWTGLVGSYLRLPNVDNRISLSFQADC